MSRSWIAVFSIVLLLAGCSNAGSGSPYVPDAGDGATADAPATDSGADTGCVGSQCGKDSGPPDSGADASCAPGTKLCGALCVLEDPANGCAEPGCSPCPQSPATCKAGACALDTCPGDTADCDGNPSNGCETNLGTDKNNCGACGHVCSLPHATAVTCSVGACEATACASGWGDCDGDSTNGCETDLDTTPYDCGNCGTDCNGAGCNGGTCATAPTTLASNQQKAMGITLDSTYVYFTTDLGVAKVPKSGGSVTQLGYLSQSFGVAVDGTNAYFTTDGSITTQNAVDWVSLAGGTSAKLVASPDCFSAGGIAVSAGTAYFVCLDGGILSVPTSGGTPTVLTTNVNNPNEIAIDANYAYYTNYATNGSVMRVPLSGGTATTIASAQNMAAVVAVDGSSVYWTAQGTQGGTDGKVMKAPLAGGAATTLVSGLDEPTGIAVDASNVYFTTIGNTGAEVARVSKAGGTPFVIAWGSEPHRVAVDGTRVYWTDSNDAVVLAAPK